VRAGVSERIDVDETLARGRALTPDETGAIMASVVAAARG
jgi:hypothetical protein